MSDRKSCRNMCFTINNYTKSDIECVKGLKWNYLVLGLESGEEGTLHIQGYVELKNSVLFTTLKNKVPRAHWEKRKGTAREASDYCKKEGDFREYGEISNQGGRSDLDEIHTMLANGMSMLEIADSNFEMYCRYNKAYAQYQYLIEERNSTQNRDLEVSYYWGDTGCGKSHKAREENPGLFSVSEGITGMWWTGYNGQTTVLLDDFRGTIPLHILLKYLDKYPVQVPVHCGYKWLRATKIIITSNLAPEELYKNSDERSRNALLRRIKNIEFFDKKFDAIKN